MGLAFGAFHHWIYEPAKAGKLSDPLLHKLTFLKAAAAGLYVYHELKLALADAQADKTLSKLVAPITGLQSKIDGITSGIKGNNASSAAITQANGTVSSIGQQASSAGQPISDIVPTSI
jgi:hypothetical protein